MSNPSNFTLIAQNVTCAYPISDLYAAAPRYLFYVLLACAFISLRYHWISHVFVGAAATYAATAAIHAIIIVSAPPPIADPEWVSIPNISDTSSLVTSIDALVSNVSGLYIQPDAVELDIDAITAVVVTAYIVGLPLQIWSRTVRSSMVVRYMMLFWNLWMLAGTISALIAWPSTNLAAPQYRFCFSGFLDPSSQTSGGWDNSLWRGSWNDTIWNIFSSPNTTWQELTDNCVNPCFNTSQIIRQSSSLKAVVALPETKFAKLHARGSTDYQPLIYTAIVFFTVAQVFLYIVSLFKLGSPWVTRTISEPHRLWKDWRSVLHHIAEDSSQSWKMLKRSFRMCFDSKYRRNRQATADDTGSKTWKTYLRPLGLIFDLTILTLTIAALALFPIIVVAFICWIEWYIRNDGDTNETIAQVGQWSPVVSVAIIFLAVCVYQFKDRLASRDELQREHEELRKRLKLIERKLSSASDVEMEDISAYSAGGQLSPPAATSSVPRRRSSARPASPESRKSF